MTYTDHAYDALVDELSTLPFDDRIGVYDTASTVIHESLTRGLVSARTVTGLLPCDPHDARRGGPLLPASPGVVPPSSANARLSPGAA